MQHTSALGSSLLAALVAVAAGCAGTPTYSGADLYAANCASCHGRYAEGDGPIAADLTRPVPDLRSLAARSGGTFPRQRVAQIIDGRSIVVAHGDRLMPVWGEAFVVLDTQAGSPNAKARAEAKIAALVDFLAGIQRPTAGPTSP